MNPSTVPCPECGLPGEAKTLKIQDSGFVLSREVICLRHPPRGKGVPMSASPKRTRAFRCEHCQRRLEYHEIDHRHGRQLCPEHFWEHFFNLPEETRVEEKKHEFGDAPAGLARARLELARARLDLVEACDRLVGIALYRRQTALESVLDSGSALAARMLQDPEADLIWARWMLPAEEDDEGYWNARMRRHRDYEIQPHPKTGEPMDSSRLRVAGLYARIADTLMSRRADVLRCLGAVLPGEADLEERARTITRRRSFPTNPGDPASR